MDHLRGMTAEAVAQATLRALARGKSEIYLSLQGKLVVFVSRFFPRLADRIAAKRVRELFPEEIAERRQRRASRQQPPSFLVNQRDESLRSSGQK